MKGDLGEKVVKIEKEVIIESYYERMRGKEMEVLGIGVMMGKIIGKNIGGWMKKYYDWRWVFYVNVKIGVMKLMMDFGFIEGKKGQQIERMEWMGFEKIGIEIEELKIFIDRGEKLKWLEQNEIKKELIIKIMGIYILIVNKVKERKKFIEKRMFEERNFVMGKVMIFVIGEVLMEKLQMMEKYIERLMGYYVMMEGMVIDKRGVGKMVEMVMVGRMK